jgi:hypothetical protein
MAENKDGAKRREKHENFKHKKHKDMAWIQ